MPVATAAAACTKDSGAARLPPKVARYAAIRPLPSYDLANTRVDTTASLDGVPSA